MHLDSALVGEIAERIGDARKVYGTDSSYVIGMITAIEWIAKGTEGGEEFKRELFALLVDGDEAKSNSNSVREVSKPTRSDADQVEGDTASSEGGGLAENTWIKGVVKWFNNDKGYGFISTDSHVDVFVHWRDISSWDRSLAQGDEVEFMVTRTAKGFQAINVMKAGQEDKGSEEGTEGSEPEEGRPVDDVTEEAATDSGVGHEEVSQEEESTGEAGETEPKEAIDLDDDGRF